MSAVSAVNKALYTVPEKKLPRSKSKSTLKHFRADEIKTSAPINSQKKTYRTIITFRYNVTTRY